MTQSSPLDMKMRSFATAPSIVLIFVAAAVYCVCFRKRKEPDSAPVQHSKADEEWSRAALAAAADSGGDGLDVGDVEIAE